MSVSIEFKSEYVKDKMLWGSNLDLKYPFPIIMMEVTEFNLGHMVIFILVSV